MKAVVNPESAPIDDQTIELTWEQPTDQVSGAGPVTNFYVEMKPADSTRWQNVSADFDITEPHCTLPTKDMKEFTAYEFRVTAENKAGKSKPSSPSNPVELGKCLPLADHQLPHSTIARVEHTARTGLQRTTPTETQQNDYRCPQPSDQQSRHSHQ